MGTPQSTPDQLTDFRRCLVHTNRQRKRCRIRKMNDLVAWKYKRLTGVLSSIPEILKRTNVARQDGIR